jgi:hypothetical protein
LQSDAWHLPGVLHYLVILTDIGHRVQAARLPRLRGGAGQSSDRRPYCGAGGQG